MKKEPAFDAQAWMGVLRGGSLLSLARGAVLVLQAAQYFVLAKLLAPSGFGEVGLFSLILLYASLTGLGSDNVAVREIPGRLAVGDTARVEKLKNITFTYELLLRASLAAAVLVAALVFYEGTLRTGMLLIAAILIFDKTQTLHYHMGSALKRFGPLSRGSMLSGLMMSVLTLTLVQLAGIYTQLLAMLVTGVVMTIYYWKALNLRPRFDLDHATFLPIVRMGLPFVGLSLVYYLWKASDRTLIAGMLSKEVLGHYTFAVLSVQLVMNFLNDFQTAFQPAVYERTAVAEGAAGLFSIVKSPSIVLAYLTAIVIGIIWVCYRVAVLAVMPEYGGTIWVFRILAAQLYFTNVAMMAVYILRSSEVNRQAVLVWSYVVAGITSYALITLSISFGLGLIGVAASTLASQFLAVAMTLAFAHRHYLPRWRAALSYYAELAVPFIAMAALFVSIYWLEEKAGLADIKKTAYSLLFLIGFIATLLVVLERRVGMLADIAGVWRWRQAS